MRGERGLSYEAIRDHARAHPTLALERAAEDFGCSGYIYRRALDGSGIQRNRADVVRSARGRAPTDRSVVTDAVAACGGNVSAAMKILRERGLTVCYGTVLRWVGGGSKRKIKRGAARFALDALDDKIARLPPISHAALTEARTMYPASVRPPTEAGFLKSGEHSAKIGGKILKGRWTGMPVYTLTLEERATCPTSCRHWRSCFGNVMPFAHRHVHGPELERLLPTELAMLSRQHPDGFVIRLHVLGDFYSVGYVKLWARMVEKFPPLRVFGYTARIDARADPISRALVELSMKHWGRFAMRFSNAPVEECSTVSIEHPVQKPEGAIICPQQLGQTESCSTCAFCWESKKPVCFIQH